MRRVQYHSQAMRFGASTMAAGLHKHENFFFVYLYILPFAPQTRKSQQMYIQLLLTLYSIASTKISTHCRNQKSFQECHARTAEIHSKMYDYAEKVCLETISTRIKKERLLNDLKCSKTRKMCSLKNEINLFPYLMYTVIPACPQKQTQAPDLHEGRHWIMYNLQRTALCSTEVHLNKHRKRSSKSIKKSIENISVRSST